MSGAVLFLAMAGAARICGSPAHALTELVARQPINKSELGMILRLTKSTVSRMVGLAELRAGASRITVRYEELPAGAILHYTSADPALHRWFEAQSGDRGVDGVTSAESLCSAMMSLSRNTSRGSGSRWRFANTANRARRRTA